VRFFVGFVWIQDEEALKVEVAILESVRHPNIVTLRQVFDSPKIFYMVCWCKHA
jgi:hypothetical protein